VLGKTAKNTAFISFNLHTTTVNVYLIMLLVCEF